MLKGLGDVGQIMKLQKEFKSTQKKITKAQKNGQSPDGKVTATVTGEYKVVNITIDPEFLKQASAADIEKKIAAAINSAVDSVKEYSTEEMGKLTGGLNIPGLGNFLK